jgi:hypothetical protein
MLVTGQASFYWMNGGLAAARPVVIGWNKLPRDLGPRALEIVRLGN